MTSKEEHHFFMESLRQSLPHNTSTDSAKLLREPSTCDNEEVRKLIEEIFEELSEYDSDTQCTVTEGKDTITANIDNVLKLQPHIWEELSTLERLNLLQTVCNIEVHYLRIVDPITIQVTNLPEHARGAYQPNNHLVLINLNHLENDPVEDVLDTVLHEVHHCYKHRLIEVYQDVAPELQTIGLFRNDSQYVNEVDNYVKPREDFYRCLNQSLELDSDKYAEQGVQEYYSRIQKWLADNAPK